MENQDKRRKIEFYIGKLQTILSKVITESKEFRELKKLVNSEDSEIQFAIFSVLMDKNSAEFIKEMDLDTLQKMIMEAQHQHEVFEPLGDCQWTEDDNDFLKDIKIVL